VLPIGGLKEKILAAQRGNIAKVIIPKDNTKDITEIPEQILKDVEIVPVEHVDEVLRVALAVDDPDSIFKCEKCIPPKEIKLPSDGDIEVEVDAGKGNAH
jgi:ATP-dependent Lon protease